MTARMGIGGGVGIFGSMSSANDRIKIDRLRTIYGLRALWPEKFVHLTTITRQWE